MIPELLPQAASMDALWALMTRQMFYAAVVFAVIWLVIGRRSRWSPTLTYAFWGLVLLRLVLPVDLASPWSAATYLSRWTEPDPPPMVLVEEPAELQAGAVPMAPPDVGSTSPSTSFPWPILWIAASIGLALCLHRQRRPYERLARSAPELGEPVAQHLLDRWRGLYGISRSVRLVSDDSRVGPFTVGTLKPVVFVPAKIARRPQLLEATLAHELAHIRRMDDLRLRVHNALRVIWVGFLPVHWAIARMRRERERICDQLAASTGSLSRCRYLSALQTMLREELVPVRAVPGMAFEKDRSPSTRKHTMRFDSLLAESGKSSISGRLIYVGLALVLLPMAPVSVAEPEAPVSEPAAEAKTETGIPAMINPMPGEQLTSTFGLRKSPFDGESIFHNGVDVRASADSKVLAPADGVVELATERWLGHEDWGTVIILDHGNGVKTRYAHLDSMKVSVGDRVKQGQVIAVPGNTGKSTGRHLHFEVWKQDERVDPATVITEWDDC